MAFFSPDLWPDRAKAFIGACLRAPNLQWLHTFSAGTDDAVFGRIRGSGVTVTSGAGAAAPSIAQTVMLYLLALSRDLPRLTRRSARPPLGTRVRRPISTGSGSASSAWDRSAPR